MPLVVALLLAALLLLAPAGTARAAEVPWEPPQEEPAWWLEGDPEVPDPTLPQPPGGLPAPAPDQAGGRDPRVPYGPLIASTARRRDLPVAFFTALVWQESAFRARARSRAGARGLTQLMPATARSLGVRKIYDPGQNLDGGARYLRAQLTRFRSKRLALAAYNAGPGAVKRFRGVPPYAETRSYVKRILSREQALVRQGIR